MLEWRASLDQSFHFGPNFPRGLSHPKLVTPIVKNFLRNTATKVICHL